MNPMMKSSLKMRVLAGAASMAIALSLMFAILPSHVAEAREYVGGQGLRDASTVPCASINDYKAQRNIPSEYLWTNARYHIGEQWTVCGKVYSVSYRPDVNGQPTFINIGADYPSKNRVQVVIWGSDQCNFDASVVSSYRGRWIEVTGTIQLYGGVPEIIARTSSQIRVCK